MENKIHIERNTVQETLIIPLFARKVCNENFKEFFSDEKAEELMNKLDYDFGDIEKKSKSIVERFGALEVAVRQKAFAFEVKEYLKEHPNASVVNLGCGLDQTAENCDNGTCKMYNIDFPDIIKIREELIPLGDRVKNISCDLNDFSWFKEIDREDGAVFFASGVFYYFTHQQMIAMFNSMAEYFKGGKLAFDIAGKFAAKMAIKAWIEQSGIKGVDATFYVNHVDKDINPFLKNAKATQKGYMLGYFDLKEKCISGLFRFVSHFCDNVFKMKIIRIDFDK